MPSTYPLTLYRGDTQRWTFRLWEDAAKTSAVDLTGATAKSEIRSMSGTLITTLACVITLPNVIDLELSSFESSTLTTSAAQWDLQLRLASGDIQTPVAGTVTLQQDVTV